MTSKGTLRWHIRTVSFVDLRRGIIMKLLTLFGYVLSAVIRNTLNYLIITNYNHFGNFLRGNITSTGWNLKE